ncbi:MULTISPECIES: YeiH family protein [unclassified Microbacterium]|uniref:YeiH family protein n=1 Tax=unclassified Microbacterium TaxID=2609290 RepID=UPI0012FD1676|nr:MULTISPECIES: putative sulfate exporter family transporter [unclassified Microbacterium]
MTTSVSQRTVPLFVAIAILSIAAATMFATALTPGVSPLLIAICLGVLVGNARVVPAAASRPISEASRKFLRIGIVLLGFKLSLTSLMVIGWGGIFVLVLTVAGTFLGTLAIGRLLRVSRVTRMLIATGFSICGASAVAAMSGVVDREGKHEEETAQAVALVTIFGTVAMFAIPALSRALGLSDLQAGLWIGASVHEVAQVVAAGGFVSSVALALATIAKLGRVVMLAPLIAIVSATSGRRFGTATAVGRPPVLPLFVAGFLAAVLLRTFVPFPAEVLAVLEFGANLLLTAAMLGLGFAVNVRKLFATGGRALALGAMSTLLAALVALGAIFALSIR